MFIDTPRPEKPYARRTLITNPSMMLLNASMVMFLVGLFHFTIPLIFFVIEFTQGNGHFTALGQAAIICYSLSWVYFLWVLPFLAFLGPVSTILIIIDRLKRHNFNAITKAYVALTFGSLVPVSLYAILWDVTIRNYAYKAWLGTFEEDWDTNGKYKTWWWIFDLNVRLTGVVEAVGEWAIAKIGRWKKAMEEKGYDRTSE